MTQIPRPATPTPPSARTPNSRAKTAVAIVPPTAPSSRPGPRSPRTRKSTAAATPASLMVASAREAKFAVRRIPTPSNAVLPSAPTGGKITTILALIQRSNGASLSELITATGWQAHSIRGAISGTLRKKQGLNITRAERADGAKIYRIAP